MNSEIDCTPLRSSDAAGSTAFAQSYRRAYLRHPNLVDLVSRRPLESETALVIYDEVSRHLRARGVAADQVMTFLTLLDYVVLGSAGETLYSDFHRPHASYRLAHPALAEALGAADAATVDDAAFALAMRLYEEAVARVTATFLRPLPSRARVSEPARLPGVAAGNKKPARTEQARAGP